MQVNSNMLLCFLSTLRSLLNKLARLTVLNAAKRARPESTKIITKSFNIDFKM